MKRAIHAPVKVKVDELISEGYSATKILSALKKEGTPEEILPSVKQLHTRRSIVKQQKVADFGFTTNEDVRVFANRNVVTTQAQFEALGNPSCNLLFSVLTFRLL